MPSLAPLAISVGDPSGVGPWVTARALMGLGRDRAYVFGDAGVMSELLDGEGVPHRRCDGPHCTLPPGTVGLVDVAPWPAAVRRAYAPTAEGGAAQLAGLDAATGAVVAGAARALVTGPTSKEAIVLAGHSFVGQTEHLARLTGLADDAVTMMFLGPRLRVALVTTHLSLREAPAAITRPRVIRTVRHLAQVLLRLASAQAEPGEETAHAPDDPTPLGGSSSMPRSLHVTGLNPHAGEAGLFGDEEVRVIGPALDVLRGEPPFATGRVTLVGPRPAEAVFRQAASGLIDGVVTMVHDQATIASKLLDWGAAVNVTWGLPFVRASVDHGVAYDAAKAGTAEAEGMVAALRMAQRLAGAP